MFRKLFNLNHRLQPEVRLRRAELLHHDLQLFQTETSGVARVKFLDLFPGELLELDVDVDLDELVLNFLIASVQRIVQGLSALEDRTQLASGLHLLKHKTIIVYETKNV